MLNNLTNEIAFKASDNLVQKLDYYAEFYGEPKSRVTRALVTLGLGVALQDGDSLKGMLAMLDDLDAIYAEHADISPGSGLTQEQFDARFKEHLTPRLGYNNVQEN